ncbi:TetR/AcrR family transcriptional regulator [Bosea caraganae]|uniref:TetR/AcrR family transcriptional regulator n=1 Tax=Bosea caraganae TaxID=2763117 RepID=A0A370L7I7_9HYPH|nr:TetR/AcrR family transcriptional regulator [Bosea caraganae]RDJ24783.1 TetR/AcrR family transcriptional regulator [Bosea caraganae]
MAKGERRQQLLATAFDMVRRDGTDTLTLATLAEQAGVTKPITYEHFGTRAGLLLALYRDYEERQNAAMHAAIAASGRTLTEVAEIVATAYVDCALTSGPASEEIAATLCAYEETKDFLQASRRACIAGYAGAFSAVAAVPPERSEALFSGILGATEALARSATSGQITRETAITTIAQIAVGAVKEATSR